MRLTLPYLSVATVSIFFPNFSPPTSDTLLSFPPSPSVVYASAKYLIFGVKTGQIVQAKVLKSLYLIFL